MQVEARKFIHVHQNNYTEYMKGSGNCPLNSNNSEGQCRVFLQRTDINYNYTYDNIVRNWLQWIPPNGHPVLQRYIPMM